MQKGLVDSKGNIDALAERLLANARDAVDIKAPVSKIAVFGGEKELQITFKNDAPPLALNSVAHSQLAEYVGIPKRYYDRTLASEPRVLATQVNHWLEREHNDETRLIRTFADGERIPRKARAFLSDRFAPLDNLDIAQSALPVLRDLGANVVSSNITERAFYLQAATPRVQREVKVGDVIQFGVALRNSEVGWGAFELESFYLRLWCLNGATGKSLFRKAHIGRGYTEEEGVFLTDQSRKLLDAGAIAKLRDATAWAFSDEHVNGVVERLQVAAGVELKKPEAAIEIVAKRFELTEGERESVLRNLISGGDVSLWGLSNAVTRVAHEGDYDRAVELESIGSQVIDLPRSAWSEVIA